MTVSVREYDFAAARQRLIERVDKTARLVRDREGKLHFDRTERLRELTGVEDALRFVQRAVLSSLCWLQVEDGGLATGAEALATALDASKPLVRAMLIIGAHPAHGGFTHLALNAGGRRVPAEWKNTPHDAGPFLARELAAARPTWSVQALEAAIIDGVRTVFGDSQVSQERLTYEQAPGSKLGMYFDLLGFTGLYDAIGALDPGFSRRDALAADWWLLQPASPRLKHDEVARKVGLELAGFLPPSAVDAPGRVVMVCFARTLMPDDRRIADIEAQKWIDGWKHEQWRVGAPPLGDATFDLVRQLEGVTDDSYGAYKHPSELPKFGGGA